MTSSPGRVTRYWAEQALLPEGLATAVLLEESDGRWTTIITGAEAGGARRLPGVIMPGFANCHSHAFHRALRGRTQGGSGTFWSWRDAMYAVARLLDPDAYLALARATYAEMALAGITAVGEFHYLHHGPDGTRYGNPNAMAEALRQAAVEAGIRLTLLDTCYLAGGLTADGHQRLHDVQRRFGDGDAAGWASRVAELTEDANTRIGAAIHSIRAVPADQLAAIAKVWEDRPLHIHLSEQPAENLACTAFYGRTPTQLLADHDVLGPRTTVVHATHLTEDDITRLGAAHTTACFCPTTERDLADGIGPSRALADAGCRPSLGTDQHAMIDIFEEAREMELHERLMTTERGRFRPDELITAMTRQDSIGWPDAGSLQVGARADLVAVRTDSPRTAGIPPEQLIFAASAPDVHTVMTDGVIVVDDHQHRLGDIGRQLGDAIDPLWSAA